MNVTVQNKLKIVTVRMPEVKLSFIDTLVDNHIYESRSEFIRHCIDEHIIFNGEEIAINPAYSVTEEDRLQLSFKLPGYLRDRMDKLIADGTHYNLSEMVRTALRVYISIIDKNIQRSN